MVLLREYYIKYKPSYWLVEGMDGSQYSVSSIQKRFRKAAKDSKINARVTPHTLRHSFATHLLQNNVNLQYIQALLGHADPKTTEIYTHLLKVNNDIVKSPLDQYIEDNDKGKEDREDKDKDGKRNGKAKGNNKASGNGG